MEYAGCLQIGKGLPKRSKAASYLNLLLKWLSTNLPSISMDRTGQCAKLEQRTLRPIVAKLLKIKGEHLARN